MNRVVVSEFGGGCYGDSALFPSWGKRSVNSEQGIVGLLEQFGVRAGAVKNYFVILFIDTINEKPIRFNMTFPPVFVVSLQWVVFMFWQKRLFINKQRHYFIKFFKVFVLFFHEFAIFLKRAVIFGSIHKVLVVRVQICKHFF